jgi:hypothetical protein
LLTPPGHKAVPRRRRRLNIPAIASPTDRLENPPHRAQIFFATDSRRPDESSRRADDDRSCAHRADHVREKPLTPRRKNARRRDPTFPHEKQRSRSPRAIARSRCARSRGPCAIARDASAIARGSCAIARDDRARSCPHGAIALGHGAIALGSKIGGCPACCPISADFPGNRWLSGCPRFRWSR